VAPIGVAQVVHSLEVGGMERVASHLALAASPEFKHTVICLTVKGHFAPELEAAGIEVVALNKQPGKDLGLPRRLAQVFREREIKVMHAHNSGPLFTGTIAARLAGVPCKVVTDHSRKFPERTTVVAAEWVLSRLLDAIVSVSEDNKVDLLEKLHWPPAKISVIPNGVAEVPTVNDEQAAALRAELGLSAEVPTVLTVARLEKQKHLSVLIEAARLLRERGAAAKFLIAGEGSDRPALEKQIAENNLGDAVSLLGWRLDSPMLYRIADLFALSSDWEGLPMSLLEAMSARLPVAVTDVGDVGKAVVPAQTGLLVPSNAPGELADALAALIGDAQQRRAYGEAGYARWRELFSVERMVERYEKLYARFL